MTAPTIAQGAPGTAYPGLGLPNVHGPLTVERGRALDAARLEADAARRRTLAVLPSAAEPRREARS